MPALTRRRDPQAQNETWRILYGDVDVGMIGIRSGAPYEADQCGLPRRGRRDGGIAPDFFTARAEFEKAWLRLSPEITEADLVEYRRERAWTDWKSRMWDAGCRLPTQESTGRSRCFCGAEIDIAGTQPHVYAAHGY